jgi:hypothetical protein
MAIEFPALKPSSYSFTPAVYNVTAPKFLNSTFSPRLNSSKPNAAILTLNYTNISAVKILSIFSAWDSSYSGFFPLTLPPEVIVGINSTNFAGRVVGPRSINWRFSVEPVLTNVNRNIGDISVTLIGEFYTPSPAFVTSTMVLYSNNFDTLPFVATGISASLTPGLIQQSIPLSPFWTGNYYANQTTSPSTLTLTGAVPAGVIAISFTLGFLGSWDSSNGEGGPDYLQILINNVPVLTQLTTNNWNGTMQNYGGGTVVGQSAAYTNNYFGSDTIVNMSTAPSLSFTHLGGLFSFGIQGYGDGYTPTLSYGEAYWDEGWGIDNLVITISPPD